MALVNTWNRINCHTDLSSIHLAATTRSTSLVLAWLDVKYLLPDLSVFYCTRLNHHKSHGWALVAHSSSAPTSKQQNQIIITCHPESNTHRLPTCSSVWSSFIDYFSWQVEGRSIWPLLPCLCLQLLVSLSEHHAHTLCTLCVGLRSLA